MKSKVCSEEQTGVMIIGRGGGVKRWLDGARIQTALAGAMIFDYWVVALAVDC
jgi:hypothetical protein